MKIFSMQCNAEVITIGAPFKRRLMNDDNFTNTDALIEDHENETANLKSMNHVTL